MKKKFVFLITLLALAVSFCSCGKKDKGLAVNEKNIRMNVGGKYTVKLASGDSDKVEWSTDNQAVAVVAADGTVTAVSSGITTVTAKDENSYVHVGVIVEGNNGNDFFDGESDITAISVGVKNGGSGDITVNVGDEYTLVAQVTPSDSDDEIMWKSADEAVARVDENGNLKVVGKGMTTITAYAPNRVKGELILRVN